MTKTLNKKPLSKKQIAILFASALLVVAAKGVSEMAHEQAGTQPGGYTRQSVQGYSRPNPSNEFSSTPSSNRAFQDAEDSSDGFSSAQDSNDQPSQDGGYAPSTDGDQIARPLTGEDMGDQAVTQGYWDRQADHDRALLGIDNEIKDQVTLENPNTGERMQADAGSDTYYQSPSVDAEMGQSTIVGADGGSSLPADATPLSVVGTDTSSASTSSSSTGEP